MDDNPGNNGDNIPHSVIRAPQSGERQSLQRSGASTDLSIGQTAGPVPQYENAVLRAERNQNGRGTIGDSNYYQHPPAHGGFNQSAMCSVDPSMDLDSNNTERVFSTTRMPHSTRIPTQSQASTGPVREPRTLHRTTKVYPSNRTQARPTFSTLSTSEESGVPSSREASDVDREREPHPSPSPSLPATPPGTSIAHDLNRNPAGPKPSFIPSWDSYWDRASPVWSGGTPEPRRDTPDSNWSGTPEPRRNGAPDYVWNGVSHQKAQTHRRRPTDPDPVSRIKGTRSSHYPSGPNPEGQYKAGYAPGHIERPVSDVFFNKDSSASDSGGEGLNFTRQYQQLEQERLRLKSENTKLWERMESMTDRCKKLMGKVETLIERKDKADGELAHALGDMSNMVASQLLSRSADGNSVVTNVNEAKETLTTFVVALASLSDPKAEVVSKADAGAIKYYTAKEWVDAKIQPDPNMSRTERNRNLAPRYWFLENRDGSRIPREDWEDLSESTRAFCNSLKGIPGALKPRWGKVSHVWRIALRNYLIPSYPILAYGRKFWKYNHFMTLWYPDFAKTLVLEGYFPPSELKSLSRSTSPAHGRALSSELSDIDQEALDSLDKLDRFSSRSPSPTSPDTLSVPQARFKRYASAPLSTPKASMKKKPKSSIQKAPPVPAFLVSNSGSSAVVDKDRGGQGQEQVNASSFQVNIIPASSSPPPTDSMVGIESHDVCGGAGTDEQPNQPPSLPPTNPGITHPSTSERLPSPLAGIVMQGPSESVAACEATGNQVNDQSTSAGASETNSGNKDIATSQASPVPTPCQDGSIPFANVPTLSGLGTGGPDDGSTATVPPIDTAQNPDTLADPFSNPLDRQRVMQALSFPEAKASGQNLCLRIFVDYANFLITGSERSPFLVSLAPSKFLDAVKGVLASNDVASRLSSRQKVQDESGIIWKTLPDAVRKNLDKAARAEKKKGKQRVA